MTLRDMLNDSMFITNLSSFCIYLRPKDPRRYCEISVSAKFKYTYYPDRRTMRDSRTFQRLGNFLKFIEKNVDDLDSERWQFDPKQFDMLKSNLDYIHDRLFAMRYN